nr:hypothetical protein NG677_04410 [Methylobacterium sp. OTU13CASTA1]
MRTFAHPQASRRMPFKGVPMRESAIQDAVMKHWRMFGLPHTLVAAIPNARAAGQAGLTKGLPDLIVIGGRVRIGFVELKVRTGRLSLEQKAFRSLCAFASIPFVDTYGRDEPIAILETWGVVRPQVYAPAAYQPRDEASEIRKLAAEGQSAKLISLAFGISVEGVEAILAEGDA